MAINLAPNNPYALTLATPVIAAAGCFGYGVEYARSVAIERMGAIVTRTTTLLPQRPGRAPRIIETAAGVLCVGPWPNPGIETVLARHTPRWAEWRTPIILSIGGESAGEYGQLAGAIEGVEGIAGLEMVLPPEAGRAVAIVLAVRRATPLPLLAKLPLLETAALVMLANALAEAGADALTLFAPPIGTQIDPVSGEQATGWLCGPAVLPLTLRALVEVAPQITLPIIACGGIASGVHAQQAMVAGAQAVQIGAALLANPHLVGEIGAESTTADERR